MASGIILREYGNSEVLNLEDIKLKKIKRNELLIRQTSIGVHFHDIYVRTGQYKTLTLPGIPGIEAVGIIEEIGSDVTNFDIGDRIVYITGEYGAYVSHRTLNANYAIRLPNTVSDELMATNFSRALTVIMLIEYVTKLSASQKILVTAASGGVGKLLCQAANFLGAYVIGTVSNNNKAKDCISYGCNEVITYDDENFVDKIISITNGKGVDIVFDSVGSDTIDNSFKVLSYCGHLVNFGQSSGVVSPIHIQELAKKSLTLSRPILFHYLKDKITYERMAEKVFKSFSTKKFLVPKAQSLNLEEASQAHKILESRRGGGSIYLRP